ncbi:hypothetical protein WJX72_009796 [[Myrmecia] bisecta]|uniref:RNA polymerase Rpb4/RPC9 core domain-containing protein n=1 Tax=[Myrmecia] bisecta TaxID=41462 RepID=A0AAW1P075_9CHLO
MADGPVEEEENAAELKLGKVFQEAQAFTNSEVALLLRQYVDSKKQVDPNYQLTPMLKKTQQYVETFSYTKNPDAAENIRTMLDKYQLSAFEIGAVVNLAPNDAEEAKFLIPSLGNQWSDEELQTMLADLATYKKFE